MYQSMDKAYLKQYGVSEADWEQTSNSVKRMVENLLPRMVMLEQQVIGLQSQIERMKEQLNCD
jgi:uncharacterized membrane protein (Fun14 family)